MHYSMKLLNVQGVIKKWPLFSNFVSYICSIFALFFFCFVSTHACYICWQYQPFWIVSLFLTNEKVSHAVAYSDFLLFEKMVERKCIKFCLKNEIKCSKIFEMLTLAFGESTMSRTLVQLYNRFKEGREDVNNDARPGRPNTLITDENILWVKRVRICPNGHNCDT